MNKENIETTAAVLGLVAGALAVVYWTISIRDMIKENKEVTN